MAPRTRRLWTCCSQHGADVNAQVTGTKTYSMRISRAPSANEGMTALHVAVQAGKTDLVRYLLEKGANPELADAIGRKPIDMLSAGGRGGTAPVPPFAGGNAVPATPGGTPPAAAERPGAGAGRSGPVGGSANPAAEAEIRTLLQNAAKNK